MNYRLLQVGEEFGPRDQVWSPIDREWISTNGGKVSESDLEHGYFCRRLERRTYIEVRGADTDDEDNPRGSFTVELVPSVTDGPQLCFDDGETIVYVHAFYAQKLIDAIKEVAGL